MREQTGCKLILTQIDVHMHPKVIFCKKKTAIAAVYSKRRSLASLAAQKMLQVIQSEWGAHAN